MTADRRILLAVARSEHHFVVWIAQQGRWSVWNDGSNHWWNRRTVDNVHLLSRDLVRLHLGLQEYRRGEF